MTLYALPSPSLGGGGPFLEEFLCQKTLLECANREPPPLAWEYLQQAQRRHRRRRRHLSVVEGYETQRLSQVGWGLVLPADLPQEVLSALEPLIHWRQGQTGRPWQATYQTGENAREFLDRHGMAPGPVDPKIVPYYLLIVGPPTGVPFEVQQTLGVNHGVGRLDFSEVADYRLYAEHVVAREQAQVAQASRMGFLGTSHDAVTRQGLRFLLEPLAKSLGRLRGWTAECAFGAEAHRRRYLELATGEGAPTLFLSLCHGVMRPCGAKDQHALQGAQVCQSRTAHEPNLLTGNDIASLGQGSRGQILILNSCFSAGTPERNSYLLRGGAEPERCAEAPFTARLAQQLLARPDGALAVIGHVDRTWNYSFRWPKANGPQIAVFESAMRALMAGKRVGSAVEESFGRRYANLAVEVVNWQQKCDEGHPGSLTYTQVYTAYKDAGSTVILGDPAVRLSLPGQG